MSILQDELVREYPDPDHERTVITTNREQTHLRRAAHLNGATRTISPQERADAVRALRAALTAAGTVGVDRQGMVGLTITRMDDSMLSGAVDAMMRAMRGRAVQDA